MRKRIVAILIIIVLLGAGGWALAHFLGQKGQVSIDFNLTDGQGLVTKLNGQSFNITGLQATYSLRPGAYTFIASKPNYKTLSTTFTLHNRQHLILTLTLQRSIKATLTNWQQVEGEDTDSGVTINQVQYFYQNTWAVANIAVYGNDTAVVVLRYDDASNKWSTVVGPGTSFDANSTTAVPAAVASYLQNNGYIGMGGD